MVTWRRYVVNRLHKLLSAEPELTGRFAFTIVDAARMKDSSADVGIDACATAD